jgi:CHAT domain-containing protein
MVSLAHAFNYAGSNSILTALWEIDENSSSKITEYFIQLLRKGFATDEALQLAKIKNLEETNGRTLASVYRAGLIIMGEPAGISFPASSNKWFWITGILILFVLTGYFLIRKLIG